jgi:hypothetical protein
MIYGNQFLAVTRLKFFGAAIFQKCCRGQEQQHLFSVTFLIYQNRDAKGTATL